MKKNIVRQLLFCTLLVFCATPLLAQDETAEKEQPYSFNFREADIMEVINFVSELTGKNFLVDEKVRGKVTIISQSEIKPNEAYKVFESILEVYGFTVVPSGKVIKILPLAEAKQKGVRALTRGEPLDPEDRVVTQLIQLKHIEANVLLPVVKPLLSNTSFATSYLPANTLIVTDVATNIAKILNIIEVLDIEGSVIRPKVEIIELNFANAKKLSTRIEAIFDAKGLDQNTPKKGKRKKIKPVKVIPYERTNSIIIISKPEFLQEAKEIISTLDVESPVGKGKINVYNLKNANSDELSKVLQSMTAKSHKPGSAPGKKTLEFQSAVTVSSFKSTNSLIIIASPQDYEIIKNIIDQLDVRRPQVFVESMIMEVSTDADQEFGIEWRTTNKIKNEIRTIGGTNFDQAEGINALSQNPLAAGTGLVIGVTGGTFSYGDKEFVNIGALLRAIKGDTNINILSTPNILTTDNEEAEIMVGENIPVQTGQSRGTGGDVIQNIKREDIGLILRIKPQISESDYVKLTIYQEISSIKDGTDLTNPITSKRTAKTVVVVKDGQNVIIGGLVKDDISVAESKIPLLGDLPLIGWLFKFKKEKRTKKNLMIFISPHIIRSHKDIEAISRIKSKEIKTLRNTQNKTKIKE